MKWLKNKGWLAATLLVVIAITCLIFQDLLGQFATGLFDWNDYPLYVWILEQNVSYFASGLHGDPTTGGIFYPYTGTLFFSDLFLPQSLFSWLISAVVTSPVARFNFIFMSTWIANAAAAWFFWRQWSQQKSVLFFATLATVFNPFVFHNWSHFQVLSLWPLLLALVTTVSLAKSSSIFKSTLAGLSWTLLLTASVYWWVIGIVIAAWWWLTHGQYRSLKKWLVMGLVALVTSAPFIYHYWWVRENYHAVRDYAEYVIYSADLTDYFFPAHTGSLFTSLQSVKNWSSYGHRAGLFPGFVLLSLSLLGVLNIIRRLGRSTSKAKLDQDTLFFAGLMGFGWLSSLGVRLTVHGNYTGIPLPYHFLAKYVPLFEVIRVTERWAVLVFFGLTYFTVVALEKMNAQHRVPVILAISVLMLAEVVPLNYKIQSKEYYPSIYQHVEEPCTDGSVLLEYPMTQYTDGVTIVTNLSYRTQMMLASLHHSCTLVNGYSGFIPKEYEMSERNLFEAMEGRDSDRFITQLNTSGADLIKLNKESLYVDRAAWVEEVLSQSDSYTVYFTDQKYSLITRTDE